MERNRRQFLKTALGVSAVPSLLAPARATAIESPRAGRSIEPTGSRIKSIETFTQGPVSIVRVRADDGAEGFGQISTYDADISATILHRKIAPHALGKDPADVDAISDRCIEANYKYPWSFVCRALTGLDTAMWDLIGKRQNKSVCELLGGKPRPFPAYGSSMRRDITPDDEAKRLVRLRDTQGFRAFKIRVGKVCGHDQDEWPGRTESLVPTVRKALGDDIALLVDGNSCYSPAKAIEVGKLLADNGVCHLEEPCPYWELEWTAQVTSTIDIPVAGGEQDNDLAQWRRMIAMHAVDIVQPDVCYVGGLTRALRVARMAAQKNLPCVPHSANLAMVTVFSLHMLGAIENAGPYVEFSIEPTDWTTGLYAPELKVVDGKVAIPDGPGWGVTIDPKWLANAQRQISERT